MIPGSSDILLHYIFSRACINPGPGYADAFVRQVQHITCSLGLDPDYFLNSIFVDIIFAINNITAIQLTQSDREYLDMNTHLMASSMEINEIVNELAWMVDKIFSDGVMSWSRFAAMTVYTAELCLWLLEYKDAISMAMVILWWEKEFEQKIVGGSTVRQWLHNHFLWAGLVGQSIIQMDNLPVMNAHTQQQPISPASDEDPEEFAPFINMIGDI